MFVKAFRIKSNSQMKNSDKKKFKAELKKKFPSLGDDAINALIPAKEEVLISKIYTFGGDSLLVYTHNKSPLFFELEKDKLVFPTVYTLWRHPELLDGFPTWPNVVGKINNGADLMLPGMLVDRKLGAKAYLGGKIKKGDPLCVYLSNNRAAIAVGTAAHSSEDMYMSGNRGKGINIIHFYGDQLWQSGSQLTLPDHGTPSGLEFLSKTDEAEHQLEEGADKESWDEEEEDEDDVAPTEEVRKLSIAAAVEAAPEPVDDRPPQEIMDELLRNAFLQSWRTSAKKAELPMLTSNLFRVHMVAQCPKNKTLDVKKSSFKKLSKFLAAMQKENLIVIRELQKGVESVTAVNLQAEAIQRHRVVKVRPDSDNEEDNVLPCDKDYEPPKITELLTVNANTAALFRQVGRSKGDGLTPVEIRAAIKDYAAKNNLQNETDKGVLNMEPVLADLVLGKGENGVISLRWDEVQNRVQAKMSPGFSLQFQGFPPIVQKGKLEPVSLSVATRSGNKKVTLVHNLEVFRINPTQFAHKCQVGVAASTSVHEAVNRKPAGAMEVLIQGNQTTFVSKLLLNEYKIPRKYILGLEEGGKKKKPQAKK